MMSSGTSLPDRPVQILYGVDAKLKWKLLWAMAFQHFVILASSFVYPIVVISSSGGSAQAATSLVSLSILAAGLGTILLSLKKNFLGSGFLIPQSASAAYIYPSVLAMKLGGPALMFGMTMFAGLIQAIFSKIIQRLHKLFPAEVSGLVILMVGVSLAPTSISQFVGVSGQDLTIESSELITSCVTLMTIIGFNIWGKGQLKIYALLIGIVAGYITSVLTGVFTNEMIATIMAKPTLSIPQVNWMGWDFNLELAPPFIVVAIAVALKGTGDIIAAQKISNPDWVRPNMKIVSNGILASSLGTMFSGFIGGMGQATMSGNIGFAAATGTLSRRISFILGIILITFAFSPGVVEFIVKVPPPVSGAVLIFVSSFIVITGLQIILSRMLDSRKTFVIGISFIFGLSVDIKPELFANLSPFLKPIFGSSLTLATLMAITLNFIFRIGIYERKTLNISPGRDSNDKIAHFMEMQGSLWGARKDTVLRATSALIEFLDASLKLNLKLDGYKLYVAYDEFSFKIDIVYRGKPLAFPIKKPTHEELFNDPDAFLALSGYMIRHYADRLRASDIADFCRITLYFDNH